LLGSPMKVKLGCCPAPLVELVPPAGELGRSSIQGTATCLPLLELELEVLLELLSDGVVLLLEGLVLVPELEPEGLLAPPELPLEELSDRIAKSIRPEPGFTIWSLMVPRVSPEELLTSQPLSWLALISWCPIRPVALKCRLIHPED
jgi:hypothetical protein